MRAIVCRSGELELTELDRPVVPDDGLLVRVHASSANPVDLVATTPLGRLMRRGGTGAVGTDFAGTVSAVGNNASYYVTTPSH